MRPAAAGFFYFAIVFAAGFLLGAVRVGVLSPAIGDLAATLVELPVILTISWITSLFLLRRFRVAQKAAARLTMGAVAFALLIAAEIALGLSLMDRTVDAQLAAMTAPPALVGLGGQILFAFFPLLALPLRRDA